jgi:hypothetical protein
VTRNAAYVEPKDEAIATAPVYTTRTVKKSGGVAPLAIAAGHRRHRWSRRGRLVRQPAA